MTAPGSTSTKTDATVSGVWQLLNPVFIPGAGLQVDLFGVPGMPYQLLFSPDLVTPFQPISPLGPPILGGELPLPIPPDPLLLGLELYYQAIVLPEFGE